MLKKTLLLSCGSLVFVIGMILFPLPVPLGLPTMILGLAMMLKASNKIKRIVIRLSNKTLVEKYGRRLDVISEDIKYTV